MPRSSIFSPRKDSSKSFKNRMEAQQRQQQRSYPPPNVPDLPTELNLAIASHLPVSSRISLKLTSRSLFTKTDPIPTDWRRDATYCEKRAVRRFVTERKDLEGGRRRCVLCNTLVKTYHFPSPDAPVCKWHEARYVENQIPMAVEEEVRRKLREVERRCRKPVWVSLERWFCVHERRLLDWHFGDCLCQCEACGHFPVMCYVRLSRRKDVVPLCSTLSTGRMYMSEEHWWQGHPYGRYTVPIPILRLEDC